MRGGILNKYVVKINGNKFTSKEKAINYVNVLFRSEEDEKMRIQEFDSLTRKVVEHLNKYYGESHKSLIMRICENRVQVFDENGIFIDKWADIS